MDQFFDIASGDSWQPESADRYNAVNRILRSCALTSDPVMPQTAGNVPLFVNIYNDTNTSIPAFSPVSLGRGIRTFGELASGSNFFAAERFAGSRNGFFGITQSSLSPGSSGRVQISGAALVTVYDTPMDFVRPDDGIFVYDRYEGYPVLTCDETRNLALIQLGNYLQRFPFRGQFALIDDSTYDGQGGRIESAVKIVNGLNPEDPFCGYTDFGNLPAERFTGDAGRIHLKAEWDDSSEVYLLRFTLHGDEENAQYFIAEWDFSLYEPVTQIWTSGYIRFRQEYFI